MTSSKRPQERHPKGDQRGGQFAAATRPREIEASLSLEPAQGEPDERIDLPNPYRSENSLALVRHGNEWSLAPSLQTSPIGLEILLTGHPYPEIIYPDLTQTVLLGNVITEMLNKEYLKPEMLTTDFLESSQKPTATSLTETMPPDEALLAIWKDVTLSLECQRLSRQINGDMPLESPYVPAALLQANPSVGQNPIHTVLPTYLSSGAYHSVHHVCWKAVEDSDIKRTLSQRMREPSHDTLAVNPHFLSQLTDKCEKLRNDDPSAADDTIPPEILLARYHHLHGDHSQLKQWLERQSAHKQPIGDRIQLRWLLFMGLNDTSGATEDISALTFRRLVEQGHAPHDIACEMVFGKNPRERDMMPAKYPAIFTGKIKQWARNSPDLRAAILNAIHQPPPYQREDDVPSD